MSVGPPSLQIMRLPPPPVNKVALGKTEPIYFVFRGATLLDNGEVLVERESMARQRGDKIVGILEGLGAHEGSINLEVHTEVENLNGRADWQSRRVELQASVAR